MPPATAIDGTATFSTDGFDFKITSAKVANVAVPSAAVVIAGLQKKITTIAIDAQAARGSIRRTDRRRRRTAALREEDRHRPGRRSPAPPPRASSWASRLDGAPIPPDLGVAVEAQLRDAAFPNAVKDFAPRQAT